MSVLDQKIEALCALGAYMQENDSVFQSVREHAVRANSWFTDEHIGIAVRHIVEGFLQREALQQWVGAYEPIKQVKTVGITMAGNIPMVGFHDFLCAYVSGHTARIRFSSKDAVLIPHAIDFLATMDPDIRDQVVAAEQLKGCDAYIATGSNNTARYFEQYFAKYPHVIRRNRTSVAILDGTETEEELLELGKDVFWFFGLGCRNVSQVCVPEGYDFGKLFRAFAPFEHLMHHHKYRNNYDYHLAVYLLNKVPYLSNDFLLLVENELPFSAVSVLHYKYYTDRKSLVESLSQSDDIQCIVGKGQVPFGQAQHPKLMDYADGVDLMRFLSELGR
jgi:hypothetical protein